jgi:dimethylsulfone monooxygenase
MSITEPVVSLHERTAMHYGNTLKLGLFGANCSSGRTLTTLPERWLADWDETLALAKMADECGIDFMLPIGRWKGYGGQTDFQGTTFETLTWASGILGGTAKMTVFGTVHTPLFHPVIAAKQMVTADRIGHGRLGLNVVCGWNQDEFEMFGQSQKDHALRYEHGDEWLRAIREMWSNPERFDFDGQFFHLHGVSAKPKPYGGARPMIMNAGRSGDGQAFAVRNCDAFFTVVDVLEFDEKTGVLTPDVTNTRTRTDDVRAQAAAIGREMGVFTRGEIVCRPTRKEAIDYWHYAFEEHADLEAVDNHLALNGITRAKYPDDFEKRRRNFIRSFPFIGDPDGVASALAQMNAAGIDGVAFSLVNYLDELPYVRDEVLPRLTRMGLRV